MAKGIGSGRVPRSQPGEEEEGVISDCGRRRVLWNAYAMNLGSGMIDSVGFPLIDTIEEKGSQIVELRLTRLMDSWG